MLGTMMLRAGLLAESQVGAAQALAAERQFSFVEAVLELSLADEDAIVAFMQSRLMIPAVRPAILERATIEVISRIPLAMAWRFLAVPVSLDALGNLTVAMADPTNADAVDAIAAQTGTYVVRAVAPLSALVGELERRGGSRQQVLDPGATLTDIPPSALGDVSRGPTLPDGAPASAGQPAFNPADTMVGMPTVDHVRSPAHTPRPGTRGRIQQERDTGAHPVIPPGAAAIQSGPAPDSRAPSHTPWQPPLSEQSSEPTPLSPEAFAAVAPRLVSAASRDDLIRILLDFLGAGFARVILFVHSRGEVRGHDCRGEDLMAEAVRQVRIPTGHDSVFARVIREQRPHFGRWPLTDPIDQAFAGAMGELPGNVLMFPVSVGSSVPLLVFAHGARNPVDPRSIQELATGTAQALQRLIARRRSTTGH